MGLAFMTPPEHEGDGLAITARGIVSRRLRRAGVATRDQARAWADARHSGVRATSSRLIAPSARDTLCVYWFTGTPNFGDAMSPDIVSWISGCSVMRVGKKVHGKVVAVGSNHTHIRPGDLVWGAGAMRDTAVNIPHTTRVLAVRGPLTAERLVGVDISTFGDPAVLLPNFHPPSTKTHRVGVVPHYRDWDLIQTPDGCKKIDVTADWKTVVDSITSCQHVISSSLHGVIVAESYGIPATWVSVSERVIGARLKFNDYYLGTGRRWQEPQIWNSDPEALVVHAPDLPESRGDHLIEAWAAAGLPLSPGVS